MRPGLTEIDSPEDLFRARFGHMKADGYLGHNHLKGQLGTRVNAVGRNFRLILNWLRSLLLQIYRVIINDLMVPNGPLSPMRKPF